jgi:hypothetical protein
MRAPRPVGLLRSHSTGTATILIAVTLLALVVLSPLALREISDLQKLNWPHLSDVAQTYGAVSALLGALALGGVVFSLIYQSRALNIASIQAQRELHNDLLKMAMEDPVYMEASGAPWGLGNDFDFDWLRKRQFVHMWITFWESRFLLKEMSNEEIREAASDIFYGAPAREYWAMVRDLRSGMYRNGMKRHFTEIVDHEYQKSLTTATSPAAPKFSDEGRAAAENSHVGTSHWTTAGVTLTAAGIGMILGRMTARKR